MKSFPLYTTRGHWAGLLLGTWLYNDRGEWMGWLSPDSRVYSVVGEYVGWLSRDFRILGRRNFDEKPPRRPPPARPPQKIPTPAMAPLAPLMGELDYQTIDVLDELPERLYTVDADPTAQDID